MSYISDLGSNFENLVEVLDKFSLDMKVVEAELSVEGKTAKQAQTDQIEHPFKYEKKRVQLRSIVHYLESKINAKRAELFQRSVENYSYDLSDRARTLYVEGTKEFQDLNQLYIEVEEIYQTYCSIVDAWKARGFALKDHTAIIINSLQDRVF